MAAISCRRCSSWPSIFSVAFFFCGNSMASLAALRWGGFVCDQCAELLSLDDALDVALLLDVEHDDGEVVVHAQGDGGRVHDFEALVDDGEEGDLRVFGRAGILHGIVKRLKVMDSTAISL